MAMLEIKNLHANAGDKPILRGVDLTVNPGEVHAIMGPNGSGKSTLAHVLAGREGFVPTEGQVRYDGKDLYVTLDPNHAWIANTDPMALVRELAPRVRATHMCDTFGRGAKKIDGRRRGPGRHSGIARSVLVTRPAGGCGSGRPGSGPS